MSSSSSVEILGSALAGAPFVATASGGGASLSTPRGEAPEEVSSEASVHPARADVSPVPKSSEDSESGWSSGSVSSAVDISRLPTLTPNQLAPPGSVIHVCRSVIGKDDLALLRQNYRIPDSFELLAPGPDDRPYAPPIGCQTFYVDAFEAGLRLPLCDQICAIFFDWCVVPGQLVPSAYRYLLQIISEAELNGIDLDERLVRYCFRLCRNVDSGWWYVRPRNFSTRRDPSPARLWKAKYFFVRSADGWNFDASWRQPLIKPTAPHLSSIGRIQAEHLIRILREVDPNFGVDEGRLADAGIFGNWAKDVPLQHRADLLAELKKDRAIWNRELTARARSAEATRARDEGGSSSEGLELRPKRKKSKRS